jgi:hypothetical protein
MNPSIEERMTEDQQSTHAVEIVNVSLSDLNNAGRQVSGAMLRINQRAMAANMVVLSTVISTNAYVSPAAIPFLVLAVLCQWVERGKLEAAQRQQVLASGLGPKGVN